MKTSTFVAAGAAAWLATLCACADSASNEETTPVVTADAGKKNDAGDASTVDSSAALDETDSGSPDAGSDAAAPRTGICTPTVAFIGRVSISGASSCTVNEHVSYKTGTATFPCAGGVATLLIDQKTFRGTVSADQIAVKYVEEFDYQGQIWISTEEIRGDVNDTTWQYRYAELYKPGQTGTPSSSCSASANAEVSY